MHGASIGLLNVEHFYQPLLNQSTPPTQAADTVYARTTHAGLVLAADAACGSNPAIATVHARPINQQHATRLKTGARDRMGLPLDARHYCCEHPQQQIRQQKITAGWALAQAG